MKANEFIKKYGLRLAKLALAEIHLSDDDGLLRAYKCPKCYTLIVDENTNGHYGCKFCDGTDAELVSFKIDCIEELKQLIKSYEFVESLGGLEKVKQLLTDNKDCFIIELNSSGLDWFATRDYVYQSILNVESCNILKRGIKK